MNHQDYLLKALHLAALGKGQCAPNPAVGAVVVKNQEVIGQGYHQAAGTPHAEIHALNEAGENARGASLYVTLEPCCHHGRTPPCTEAILKAGIREVIFGFLDPNPKVAGQGQTWLNAHGIPCLLIPDPEIQRFYQSYTHWTTHHMPWLTAKLALSLDGKIAGPEGQPIAISRPALEVFTHQCRRRADAILTSVRTIIHDDPRLNVRLDDETLAKPLYILDRQLRLPAHAKIFSTAAKITVFHEATGDLDAITRLEDLGARCISLPCQNNHLDLAAARFYLGRDGMHDVWIEAGGQVFSHLLTHSLLDEAFLYIGLKALGQETTPAFKEALDFMQYFSSIAISSLDMNVICHFRR